MFHIIIRFHVTVGLDTGWEKRQPYSTNEVLMIIFSFWNFFFASEGSLS